MSLFKKASMINNMYYKKFKKSILEANRTEIFLLTAVFLLITIPLFVNLIITSNTAARQKYLYLSPRFEEFFGDELVASLMLEFEEQNPYLRLRFYNSNNTNEQSLGPDILIFEKGELSTLAVETLAPLNFFLDTQAENTTEIESYSSALITEPHSALQFAVPLVSFMDLLFYNIDLLKAAGFDRPPKTRAEFLYFARTVSNNNDGILAGASGVGMGLSPKDRQSLPREIFSWIWASGNNFWSSGSEPIINDRITIRDLAFLGSLNREGVLLPGSFEATGEQRIEDFAQRRIALMVASTRVIPYLRERMGENAFGITTIPTSESGGQYSIGLSGIYVGINSAAEYMEAAFEFLSFLVERRVLFSRTLYAVPGDYSDLLSSDYIDYMKDDPFYSKALDIFQASVILPGFSEIPGGKIFEDIVREEFEIFFNTNRSPEAAAAAIQQRWQLQYHKLRE